MISEKDFHALLGSAPATSRSVTDVEQIIERHILIALQEVGVTESFSKRVLLIDLIQRASKTAAQEITKSFDDG